MNKKNIIQRNAFHLPILIFRKMIQYFVTKDIIINRTIMINRSSQDVFDYIKFIRNHDNFNVWAMMDLGMQKKFSGTDGQIGFTYAWDSKNKNVGAGEQEIKDIKSGESIELEVRFMRPMKNIAFVKITTSIASNNQTDIQWYMKFSLKFPISIIRPFLENMLGKDMKKSLVNLKSLLENQCHESESESDLMFFFYI